MPETSGWAEDGGGGGGAGPDSGGSGPRQDGDKCGWLRKTSSWPGRLGHLAGPPGLACNTHLAGSGHLGWGALRSPARRAAAPLTPARPLLTGRVLIWCCFLEEPGPPASTRPREREPGIRFMRPQGLRSSACRTSGVLRESPRSSVDPCPGPGGSGRRQFWVPSRLCIPWRPEGWWLPGRMAGALSSGKTGSPLSIRRWGP